MVEKSQMSCDFKPRGSDEAYYSATPQSTQCLFLGKLINFHNSISVIPVGSMIVRSLSRKLHPRDDDIYLIFATVWLQFPKFPQFLQNKHVEKKKSIVSISKLL